MKGQGEVLIESEGVKEGCALEEITHFAADLGQPVFIRCRHIFTCHHDFSSVCFQEANHQFQGHTLAGPASAQDADCFSLSDGERHLIQNLPAVKTLFHLFKHDRGAAGLSLGHMAWSGKRKKMHLTRMTSAKMTTREETTTLLVAALRTPSEPSLVL